MTNTFDFKETWQSLKEEKNISEGFFRRKYPSEKIDIFLAVESVSKVPAVILKVSPESIPAKTEYPESRKFEVFPLYSAQDNTVSLFLKLNDTAYSDIFLILAEDIVRRVSEADNEKICIEVFLNELFRWQEFLKQYSEYGLSDNAQRGLYGELWFIKNILMKNFDLLRAVEFWCGAEKATHDFQIMSKAVEIKTYSGASHPKITVSNMNQLDTGGADSLFLGVLLLDVRTSGVNTLPHMTQSVKEELSSNSKALKIFEDKLVKYGYFETQVDQYIHNGYAVNDILFYEVNEKFPKISAENLPDGIGDLSYSVILSACSNAQCSQEHVLASLKGRNDE